jgi:NTP pyrophosphatase (non-canonical NTP hydrolase)
MGVEYLQNLEKLRDIVANDPAPKYFSYDRRNVESSNELTFDLYQTLAMETAVYPGKRGLLGLLYCGLGTAEEAGEVAGKIKKVLRDNNGVVDGVQRERIKKEMGDVLWYLAGVAKELGINLGSVARENILKLQGRRERGTIHGDGDDR